MNKYKAAYRLFIIQRKIASNSVSIQKKSYIEC